MACRHNSYHLDAWEDKSISWFVTQLEVAFVRQHLFKEATNGTNQAHFGALGLSPLSPCAIMQAKEE